MNHASKSMRICSSDFYCLPSHTLTVHRFKDAKELYQGRKYEMFFWDNKACLVVKDTAAKDTGHYRCEVDNPLGRIESTGNLTVYREYGIGHSIFLQNFDSDTRV